MLKQEKEISKCKISDADKKELFSHIDFETHTMGCDDPVSIIINKEEKE